MKILLTGSSGCLASALLPALCEQDFVHEITGLDVRQANHVHSKYRHVVMDMRDERINELMAGHDAVIHLGFAVKRGALSLDEMHNINVTGSCNVVDAARRSDIKKFVNLSSASVYGPGEDMPETAERKPPAWFPYARHKTTVEDYIERQLPSAVQFRSHLIVGANAQKFLREIFLLPVWLDFSPAAPRQQVVHEADVVDAILAALQQDVRGFYNLAAGDVIALGGDYIRKGQEEGRKIRRMPFGVARALAVFARVLMQKDLLTLISMLDTTATVNCDKASRELGWRARRSAWDARDDALKSLRAA